MKTKIVKVINTKSTIYWVGRKVTGAHNGTIAIKEGSLIFDGTRLTAGKFIIDMTSIKILDVTDPATNAQFAGHLASDDFFATEKFPEASFEISSAVPKTKEEYEIKGQLTIKGMTHPAIFTAGITFNDEGLNATGQILVDRTNYDIRFRSGNFFKDLGDTLIYNDFELNIRLTAKTVDETVLA
jgi:polyisoprenoid-binding protein YceI